MSSHTTIDLTGASPSPECDTDNQAMLIETINSIDSIHRLRSTLLDLIRTVPAAAERASVTLLVKQPSVESPASNKRRPRFETCENCKEEYDVVENDAWDSDSEEEEDKEAWAEGAPCRYHPASATADYDSDIWADHDEACHGPIDTPENLADFPEGFTYQCCDANGYSAGCIIGRHVPKSAKKRAA